MNVQAGFVPHVTTLGQGPRRALALHCTLAHGGAWGGLAALVGDDLTLVAPDMASHGRSPDWDGISDFPDTTLAASAALLEDEPMDIIGHSFGAATAMRLAIRRPQNIRSLILIEPVLFGVAQADQPETLSTYDSYATDYAAAVASGDNAAAARAFNRIWSDGPKWDDLPERSRAAMIRAIPVVNDTQGFVYDERNEMLCPGGVDSVQIPTLLMRGEHALPAIVAVNDGLERRVPNAKQAVIPGAGHMAPISHPEATAELIRPFLAAH